MYYEQCTLNIALFAKLKSLPMCITSQFANLLFAKYTMYTVFIDVTRFWKTEQIVILDLAYSILLPRLMATLIHYTSTVPLLGLVNWSAFLERVLPTL